MEITRNVSSKVECIRISSEMCISSVCTGNMYVTMSAKWRLQAGQLGLDSQH